MFDINAIVTAALLAAVEQATKPLLERIVALENNPAQGTDTTLLARVVALEGADDATTDAFNRSADRFAGIDAAQRVMVERIQMLEDGKGMTAAAFVTYLDGDEAFWEKVSRKAGEVAQTVAEETVHDHTCEYDHDGYDDMAQKLDDLSDPEDFVKRDDLDEAIDNRLDNALEDKLEEKVLEKMDDHLQTYDHDGYDNLSSALEEMGDIDDLVKREELRAEIEDVIGNARISIKL